jgi:hypothetical protein
MIIDSYVGRYLLPLQNSHEFSFYQPLYDWLRFHEKIPNQVLMRPYCCKIDFALFYIQESFLKVTFRFFWIDSFSRNWRDKLLNAKTIREKLA